MSADIYTWEQCKVKSKLGFISIISEKYNGLKPMYRVYTYDKDSKYRSYIDLRDEDIDIYTEAILALAQEISRLKKKVNSYKEVIKDLK